jgi:hypothetical protein
MSIKTNFTKNYYSLSMCITKTSNFYKELNYSIHKKLCTDMTCEHFYGGESLDHGLVSYATCNTTQCHDSENHSLSIAQVQRSSVCPDELKAISL